MQSFSIPAQVEPPRHPPAEIGLLGGFRLRTSSGPACIGHSGQRLLALLALEGRPLQREVVASRLWPEHEQARALANLRSVIWRLPSAAEPLVTTSGGLLGLGTPSVDVHRLVAAARAVVRNKDDRSVTAIEILELDRELLPGWDEQWVVAERERLRQLRLLSLEAMCTARSRAGDYALAIEAGMLAVELEPLRESAHRALISAHLAQGNVAEARRQYDELRCRLREQLDIEPSRSARLLLWPGE